MSLYYRKSKNIGNGTRLNINKKSVGISTGVKGARISANSKGNVRMNLSIPGTGFRYTKTIGKGSSGIAALFIGLINITIYICKSLFILIWWLFKIMVVAAYYICFYICKGCKAIFCRIKSKFSKEKRNEL